MGRLVVLQSHVPSFIWTPVSCLVESSYILHKGSVCERLHDETIVNDSDTSEILKISVLALSPVFHLVHSRELKVIARKGLGFT